VRFELVTVVGQQEGTGSHLPGAAELFRGIGRSWLSDYVNYPLWMGHSWPIGIALRGLSALIDVRDELSPEALASWLANPEAA
jgi:hypothetical protein